MTTLREKINALPPKRKALVQARAAQLIADEMSLRDLRKAHKQTQVSMAKKLHIKQESVSRLEQRSDMFISTLRDYVIAMGGQLRFTAEFPNRPPVELKGLGILQARKPKSSNEAKMKVAKSSTKARAHTRNE